MFSSSKREPSEEERKSTLKSKQPKEDIIVEPRSPQSTSLAFVNYADSPKFVKENPNAPLFPSNPEVLSEEGLTSFTVANRERGTLSEEEKKEYHKQSHFK